jgi:hypothetical protein
MVVERMREEPVDGLGAQLVASLGLLCGDDLDLGNDTFFTICHNRQEKSDKSVQISKEKCSYRVYMSKFEILGRYTLMKLGKV